MLDRSSICSFYFFFFYFYFFILYLQYTSRPDRILTDDHLISSEVLYTLSYGPTYVSQNLGRTVAAAALFYS